MLLLGESEDEDGTAGVADEEVSAIGGELDGAVGIVAGRWEDEFGRAFWLGWVPEADLTSCAERDERYAILGEVEGSDIGADREGGEETFTFEIDDVKVLRTGEGREER